MIRYLTLVLVVLMLSCEFKDPAEELKDPNIRIVRDINGNVKSVLTMKDSVIHGPAKIYYEGGKVISSTMTYRNNKKHGLEKKFYKTGDLYRERNYIDGKLQGIEKRYFKNGKLRTEVSYKDSNPSVGLKEYTMAGDLVTEYPDLEMTTDRTEDGLIRMRFQFTDGSKVVTYYEGELIEGKYFDRSEVPLGEQNGIGEKLIYDGEQNSISISARLTTRNNAPYIVYKRFVIE